LRVDERQFKDQILFKAGILEGTYINCCRRAARDGNGGGKGKGTSKPAGPKKGGKKGAC